MVSMRANCPASLGVTGGFTFMDGLIVLARCATYHCMLKIESFLPQKLPRLRQAISLVGNACAKNIRDGGKWDDPK
jgi:hypothetical protein